MARINNNPLLKGISGMLGDVVVYREQRGQMVMSNRPKKRDQPTEHQKSAKSRFLQAVQYAKGQVADPITKALYAAGINDRIPSAYSVAIMDYLKGPEIISVNTKEYQGQVGQLIEILAIDNFKVVEVSVEIRSAANVVIESGVATGVEDNNLLWRYNTKESNSMLEGTQVIVRAKDKPGNVTEMLITLPVPTAIVV
jgi:hypothetical protein